MSDKFSMEVVRKIHDGENGVHICVGPDRDVGGYVEIYTHGRESEEFFGEIRLVFPPKMAKLVAEAMLAAASEIEP